jgi:hypothetical protein
MMDEIDQDSRSHPARSDPTASGRRHTPAESARPRVDPGLKASGCTALAAACRGRQDLPPTATMPTGRGGPSPDSQIPAAPSSPPTVLVDGSRPLNPCHGQPGRLDILHSLGAGGQLRSRAPIADSEWPAGALGCSYLSAIRNVLIGLPVPRDEEVHEPVLDILTGCCLHQEVGHRSVVGWQDGRSVQAVAVKGPLG